MLEHRDGNLVLATSLCAHEKIDFHMLYTRYHQCLASLSKMEAQMRAIQQALLAKQTQSSHLQSIGHEVMSIKHASQLL